jgi:hypothetical protein
MSIRLNNRIREVRSWSSSRHRIRLHLIGAVAFDLSTQLGSVGKVALVSDFVIGIGMLASGFTKLKQAADTQASRSSTVKVPDARPLGRG